MLNETEVDEKIALSKKILNYRSAIIALKIAIYIPGVILACYYHATTFYVLDVLFSWLSVSYAFYKVMPIAGITIGGMWFAFMWSLTVLERFLEKIFDKEQERLQEFINQEKESLKEFKIYVDTDERGIRIIQ